LAVAEGESMSEDQIQPYEGGTIPADRPLKPAPAARAFQPVRAVHRAIELMGKHPFVTGLLALLGILGFIISVAGFQLDRKEATETTAQIQDVDAGVEVVVGRLTAPCSSPPCWGLSDLMSASTIGKPKDLLDRKLPPAGNKENGQYAYELDGCRAYIEYRDDAVSFVSASLFKYEKTGNGEYRKAVCPFEIPGIMHANADDAAEEFPGFPRSNADVTLEDVLGLLHDDLKLSVACVECGNYAEPFVQAYAFGPHSSGFIDFYFTVASYDSPDMEGADDSWSAFRRELDAIGPHPDEYDMVETADYCGMNIRPHLTPLYGYYVSEVGVGRGERVWSGPEALRCP
jgi:hypothetical protein